MPLRFIFRMTDYRDVEQFLHDGEIRSINHPQMQLCYQASHSEIAGRRGDANFSTPCGGVVNDYVQFYFSPITSMYFAISKSSVDSISPQGINIGKVDIRDRIFFVSNVDKFNNFNGEFYFTNVAHNKYGIVPNYSKNLADIENHINWSLFDDGSIVAKIPEIQYGGVTRWCHDTDTYRNRKSQRMAEFLVKRSVPMEMFDCIVTQNEEVRCFVQTAMTNSKFTIPVYCKPGCFL